MAASLAGDASRASEGACYVLVHGAWHGGWCWERLREMLEPVASRVLAPTLPGLAERSDELSPATGLRTHIDDVVGALEGVTSERLVLVGHSYGGMVIRGVADCIPGRIDELVFLDAFVPRHGQCQWELMAPTARAQFAEEVGLRGGGWLIPPPCDVGSLGLRSESDRRLVAARLTPHPLRTFLEPLLLHDRRLRGPKLRYIACVRDGSPFARLQASIRAQPAWRYQQLVAGHDAMLTHARTLARLLAS